MHQQHLDWRPSHPVPTTLGEPKRSPDPLITVGGQRTDQALTLSRSFRRLVVRGEPGGMGHGEKRTEHFVKNHSCQRLHFQLKMHQKTFDSRSPEP